MTLQARGVKIFGGRSGVASMLGTAIGGIPAMHDSLANTSKGNMIDNPDQVERLIARLRQSLPLFATVTSEVAAMIRERSPTAADPQRRYPITRVDYAGDEGGIVCKVEWPGGWGQRSIRINYASAFRACGTAWSSNRGISEASGQTLAAWRPKKSGLTGFLRKAAA
jgi:hypothetical protein